ncbi:MAG: AAA family ATPase [Bacteroidia bacterium 44-10]|nr:MAG: AAA family ATPase [Bacteroidia bacterium 44-10]
MTIKELQQLKESEDRIEFKEAKNNFSFAGGKNTDQTERRKCYLGYVVALANEGGGKLVMGMKDKVPHEVVGSDFAEGKVGDLTDETYERLGIRVRTEELWEDKKRVLIIHVPTRPVGKLLKFEGVPLMRTGESLRNMSDEEMFAILSEQEPDFSAKICEGLTIADLDDTAIQKMRESYSQKQNNPQFLSLSKEQLLTDLKLLVENKLNFAALILLGKKEIIQQKLPQSKIIWEYRNTGSQIHHDARESIEEPLFLGIDKIWQLINQPALNRKHPVQSGAYIFDLFDFNEAVIREAILNAVAHRLYTITSEVVVKQYPTKIEINNPGGFPKGVTLDNLITVSSTPRNRLITEILEKTGLVERSGQGVDKIFSITLSEGKNYPDYSKSDSYQVSLTLKSEIVDKAFHIFINKYQISDKEPKLGVEQILTLSKIRDGQFQQLNPEITNQLEEIGLIQRASGHTNRFTLSEEYNALIDENSKIGNYIVKEVEQLLLAIQGNALKIGAIEKHMEEYLNRNQLKYLTGKLVDDDILTKSGSGNQTTYSLAKPYQSLRGDDLFKSVFDVLRSKNVEG